MTSSGSNFVMAGKVRSVLVEAGDIRAEIEFQNDINGLLARLDEGSSPLVALAPPLQPPLPETGPEPRPPRMRVIRGGAMPRARAFDDYPVFIQGVALGA